MEDNGERIAVVGLGAILPDAPTAPAFWTNVKQGRYSIGDVPVGRWDPDLYYDSDRKAPDKTYSKIGGWVKEWNWDPLAWRLPIPPRVGDEMDDGQKWAIACTREALLDYGYPERPLDPERTAVIIGNAMAGEKHYLTAFRIMFPELAEELIAAPNFMALPRDVQNAILSELQTGIGKRFPEITEDTMPGELSNILAGRVANLYNFRGPSFTTDAACASGLAAISAAVQGLRAHEYDSVVTGGVDRNMGVAAFVKFCKIGALSATGTRPYAAGADGFVMGEGGALFLLKRLADAERDGDTIYAVIRSLAGSSDGKGKGITAPNPIGQRLAIERAWRAAGVSPGTATLIEGHGTSTTVGDAVELDSLRAVFGIAGVPRGAIALGSVKSNIGHLKSAAGAAGILKTIYALHDKVLPPSINFNEPNPGFDWASVPFRVNTELREWEQPANDIRRAGVSAFGFGGTNFHAVLEEYVPGSSDSTQRHVVAVNETRATEPVSVNETRATEPGAVPPKAPLRGAMVIGAPTTEALAQRLATVKAEADAGRDPARAAPSAANLSAPERLAIDYADAPDLAAKAEIAAKAIAADNPAMWKALRPRGIFRGTGPAPKVAFLYTGQGSQYVNMLKELRKSEPIVAQTFADADRVMAPLLGKALSDYIFVDGGDAAAVGTAEADLMQTAITQPAVLATDLSLTKLLGAYGIHPDMVMGHSLGEYGALVAAGALTFDAALEAVSARGREMTNVVVEDSGKMAAIVAPLKEVERIVDSIDGYVVVANMNSNTQAVIGGASDAVDRAVKAFSDAGFQAIPLPVSHAFHTSIVAPASGPLREVLVRLELRAPEIPIVANVTGDFYPMGDGVVPQMLDILSAQVASPVQFAKGLRTLYEAGARVFVEVGPKKALAVFADDVLGDHADVLPLFTNHPKIGDIPSFNQALCGLYAAGLGVATTQPSQTDPRQTQPSQTEPSQTEPSPRAEAQPATAEGARAPTNGKLEALFAEFLERARQISDRKATEQPGENERPDVVVTGAALGLPGTPHVFDDANVGRILNGEQLIGTIPETLQKAMLAKHITRLVKRENGDPRFETIDDAADVIKLAGRAGAFDLAEEFGVSADRLLALDRSTQLAIGAGIDALRDAGIPLVRKYRTTAKGTKLPEGWTLPEGLRDDTGVIFASAFPGLDAFADEISRYQEDRARREQLADLEEVRARSGETDGQRTPLVIDLDTRIAALRTEIDDHPYEFDRRFLFKCLSMGHAQFAEIVGARGPNTQINSACASTTLAFGLAEDWIRAGRCRRVLVVAADDATSDHMMEWIGAGFLASGAAATDAVVEDAATPFDRRRHGMLIGMGAAAFVVEREDAPRERGIRPICQLLGVVTANSAFHGSRLDVEHISGVMESLISGAETRWGIARAEIAPQLVFVSHETYTPARGGSAAAEVEALRHVFGAATDRIVVANTKGFTGHPMGVGIEDVVAVKTLETGLVPPVPNFKDVDPDLGTLNLSTGGAYPVRYALRLAAGFGSQISMSLLRWIPSPNGSRTAPEDANYTSRIDDPDVWNGWLTEISGDAAPELEVVQRALHVKAHSDRPAKAARDDKTPPSVASPVETAASLVETAPSVAVAAARSEDEIRSTVLGLVAEKTGYPADMLELDLDLEADLGVDTVKQAEIFVALRETYGIPRDDALKLRDFPTLSHVIGFVRERAAGSTTSIAPAEPAESPAEHPEIIPVVAGPTEEEVKERVLGLVAEKTGYPADMLELDLDLEADLGVDTVKQAEIFVALRETYGIPRDDALKLRDFPTLSHVIGFVRERAVAAEPPAAVSEPVATPAEQPDIVPIATPAGPTEEEVKERVLGLVAEKTGYPADMLELDLDLEADLGVDTVKQAEIFVALRETYGIPRDDALKLRDFPTLAHVIGFVRERAAGTKTFVATPVPVESPAEHPEIIPVVAGPTEEEVKERVLGLVAEKTGYPADMLELDLDLEADLGVDTVKQAEIFVALRETYGIPRDDALKLRDFPTLAHVIGFVRERAAAAEPPIAPAEPAQPSEIIPTAAATGPSEEEVKERVLGLVAEKTGYPADMLELDLDLEADLGVDTVKQAEIFVALRETYGIPRDDTLKLRDFPTLSHVIGFVKERAVAGNEPPAAVSEPVATPAEQPDIVPIATPAGPTEEEVKERVLGLVAEKTGYPADMLELDLDLEADLGVDTVKQAEIFVALRETYGIPRDDALKLRDFPTLAHVIGFVRERAARSTPSIATPERVEEPAKQQPEPLLERAIAGLDAANVIPRRVPVPVLRPPLDRCKETSATLRAGGRVVVMADASGVAKELSRHLEAMEVEPLLIDDAPSVEVLSERLRAWLERGPIAGVYWLASLDPSLPLRTMDLPQWREALRVRVKLLFATMRALVAADGPPPFLVAGTRMGGLHGYDDAGAADPLGGAVTGFVKAFGRELPEALVKAVDFGEDTSADGAAGRLLDETLKDPGAVEIGYRDGLRWGISLDERPAPKPDPSLPFGAGTVFAVTGAAGSIVSAIVSDLAAATGATFHLLDLAPEPNPADPDLLRFTSDREGLKRDLFDRIKARGERATPAVVDRELANLERARAAVSSMEAIHAAGGTARYHEVNLLDADAVGRAIEDIIAESGRIDVLIHAAGIEISHLIADKEPREFDLVFDVKADGLFNVMHSLGERNPRAVVVFSSVAGRFGNAGQTDYSAANGLQCTVASSLRRTRTGTRGIAIDWTAWAKIGMATRGSIPKMMELAGIDMLEPEAGIPVVRRELLGGTDGEVVIGGRLGALLAEPDDTGGVMPGAWTAPVAALPWTATAMTIHGGLTARADLDPTTEPFLDNHRIDGTPVLPGVMGMESFAEVALLVLPGWHVAAIDDVEFLAPFKFYRDTPRTLTVEARFTHEGDDIVAACRLLGIRELPNQPDPQVTTHFTGTVRLSRTPGPLGSSPLPDRTGAGVGTEDVYSVFFHGPAYRVLERVWTGSGGATGLMTAALPPDFHGPIPPAIAPRLIELCFQTAAAWDIAAEGRFGLPTKVGTVRVSSEQSPNGPLVASVTHVDGRTDATVVDETGRILVELKGYESVELPGAIDLDTKSAKAFRAAMAR